MVLCKPCYNVNNERLFNCLRNIIFRRPGSSEERGNMYIWVSVGIFVITLVVTIVFKAINDSNDSTLALALAFFAALAGGIANMVYLFHQDVSGVGHVIFGILFVILPMLSLALTTDEEIAGTAWFATLVLLAAAAISIGC